MAGHGTEGVARVPAIVVDAVDLEALRNAEADLRHGANAVGRGTERKDLLGADPAHWIALAEGRRGRGAEIARRGNPGVCLEIANEIGRRAETEDEGKRIFYRNGR